MNEEKKTEVKEVKEPNTVEKLRQFLAGQRHPKNVTCTRIVVEDAIRIMEAMTRRTNDHNTAIEEKNRQIQLLQNRSS